MGAGFALADRDELKGGEVNRRQKGRRTALKVRKWLEEQGFCVEGTERSSRYGPKDIWAADLIAIRDDELFAIQVKSNRSDRSRGRRDLRESPWPSSVRRVLIVWENYAREPITEFVPRE